MLSFEQCQELSIWKNIEAYSRGGEPSDDFPLGVKAKDLGMNKATILQIVQVFSMIFII
jgi:hypothetical protein